MELKTNNTYIFEYQKSSYTPPFKGRVVELTKTTIFINNLDNNVSYRENLKEFNSQWKAIELVENWKDELNKAMEKMKQTPLEWKVKPEEPQPKYYRLSLPPCGNQMCLCDGSCWRTPSLTGAIVYNPLKNKI